MVFSLFSEKVAFCPFGGELAHDKAVIFSDSVCDVIVLKLEVAGVSKVNCPLD